MDPCEEVRNEARRRERDAEDLGRRAALEREKRSIRTQYATWARENGLALDTSEDVACGVIGGRQIRFDMGRAGKSERKPKIDVPIRLDVAGAIFVQRAHAAASEIEHRVSTVLAKVDLLETIRLSESGLRLAFEPRVHPDVFDAALDALDEAPRSSPYR